MDVESPLPELAVVSCLASARVLTTGIQMFFVGYRRLAPMGGVAWSECGAPTEFAPFNYRMRSVVYATLNGHVRPIFSNFDLV